MRRSTPALFQLAALCAALLTGCGSSASGNDSPTVGAPSPGAAGSTGAKSSAAAHGNESPGVAAATTGAHASRSAGAAASASPPTAGTSGDQQAAANEVPLPPPGSYTYRVRGKSSSALGDQSLDGDSTLRVDQPQGNREHSTQQDRGGSTEQVLVARTDGLYLAEIHLKQPGFDEDFKPAQPVLLFPGSAQQGQRWHWQMTSTDGKYTLTAHLTVDDLHSSAQTTDGQVVQTVALSSVLHVKSDDIDMTIHQHDEAGKDGVIVRERAVSDGTAYGTKFHSEATRVLRDRP